GQLERQTKQLGALSERVARLEALAD
ncbi:MAG: hypothetical protein JWO33_815, partial [Caulobacteraceae bacterium]|nr:hypothetical protein [Caulobacteraceae bacterium]